MRDTTVSNSSTPGRIKISRIIEFDLILNFDTLSLCCNVNDEVTEIPKSFKLFDE